MLINIVSTANKTFKHIKALGRKNYREKYKEFVIEGVRLLKEALQSHAPIKAVLVSESFLKNDQNRAFLDKLLMDVNRHRYDNQDNHTTHHPPPTTHSIYTCNDRMFKEMTHTETPQGILAVAAVQSRSLKDITEDHRPFFVYCDAVQDPGNMGTIIRTADAAGADAVIVSGGCADIYNPKTVRSTMGSLFHLPVIKVEDSRAALSDLKERGLKVIAGHLCATAKNHFEVDMKRGLVLVIGNEANGVSKPIVELSDYIVKIPILGRAESLNAGIASGILMYEIVRQRMK